MAELWWFLVIYIVQIQTSGKLIGFPVRRVNPPVQQNSVALLTGNEVQSNLYISMASGPDVQWRLIFKYKCMATPWIMI